MLSADVSRAGGSGCFGVTVPMAMNPAAMQDPSSLSMRLLVLVLVNVVLSCHPLSYFASQISIVSFIGSGYSVDDRSSQISNLSRPSSKSIYSK